MKTGYIIRIYGNNIVSKSELDLSLKEIKEFLQKANESLSKNRYLCGQNLTFSDISLLGMMIVGRRRLLEENFMKPYQKVNAWMEKSTNWCNRLARISIFYAYSKALDQDLYLGICFEKIKIKAIFLVF